MLGTACCVRIVAACPAALIISVNFPLIGSKPISPNPNAHWHASARDVRGEVGSRRFLRGRGRDRRKPAPGAGGVALGAGGEPVPKTVEARRDAGARDSCSTRLNELPRPTVLQWRTGRITSQTATLSLVNPAVFCTSQCLAFQCHSGAVSTRLRGGTLLPSILVTDVAPSCEPRCIG